MIKHLLLAFFSLALFAAPVHAQNIGTSGISPGTISQVPSNNLFCVIGDSRFAHGFNTVGVTAQLNYGPQTWMAQITDQAINFPIAMEFAVSGVTTTTILNTQVPQVLAAGCGNVLFIGGTNDGSNNSTSNYQSIFSQIINSGRHLWVITETPRGNASFPAQRYTGNNLLLQTNRSSWLQSAFATYGPRIHEIDVYPLWYDPNSATAGDVLTTITYDGLHENIPGAYSMATTAQPEINRVFGPTPLLAYTNAWTFDATYNPAGMLGTNLAMSGTGGTCNSPCTGTMATGWTLQMGGNITSATGFTIAGSQVTTSPISGSGNWQQVAMSGTSLLGGAPFIRYTQTATVTGEYSAGDRVEGLCQYEMDTTTGIYALYLEVDQDGGGTKIFQDGPAPNNTIGNLPAGPIHGTLRTQPFTATGSETSTIERVVVRVQDASAQAFNTTIRTRNCYIHKLIAAQ